MTIDCLEDSVARPERAGKTSADFALTAGTSPIGERNLHDAETRFYGFHLHFHVPSPGRFGHPEVDQRRPADGAKWTHVPVAMTRGQGDQGRRETISIALRPGQRPGLGELGAV